MSTFVLVHGGWHGAWCWYKIVARLENLGHKAIAVDLSGHGTDKTPLAEITLQSYTDSVCKVLDAPGEPVVLVGHSMGGGVITQVAEYHPDKIKTLVYLAAAMPQNGMSLMDAAKVDEDAYLLKSIEFTEDRHFFSLRPETLKEALYADCSDEDIALARCLLIPQSIAPVTVPVKLSDANFGRIPRVDIECLKDNGLSLVAQRRLYTATPCQKVISMNTSHSPFFSAPDELTAHLAGL